MNSNKKINLLVDAVKLALIIFIACALVSLIVLLVSDDPMTAITSFFIGPFTSLRRIGNIIEAAAPLMFTALAVIIIFGSGQFSMIAEGSFFIGTSGAMVTSIMFNYVVQFFAIYLGSYHFREVSSSSLASLKFEETAGLPVVIPGTRIHAGIVLGIVLCILVWFFLYRTSFGTRLRITGENPLFAKYSGLKVTSLMLVAQIIAGAIAGMGGGAEILGMYNRFKWTTSPGYGWTGIVVALLARSNPLLVPLAAAFIGYLNVGADIMARSSDVGREVVDIIQDDVPDRSRCIVEGLETESDRKSSKSRGNGGGAEMKVLSYIISPEFVYMWIRVATPIIFSSLGGVICSRAVNLGLEGIMLISALAGVLGSAFGGSLLWGMVAGLAAALAVSALFAYFHLVLKANNVLCGTAVNTMASGLTVFVLQLATGEKGNSSSLKSFAFPQVNIPVIKDIPVLGSIISGHNALTYFALLMVFVIWFFLYKTPMGLRMRAVGENPDAASSVGQNVTGIRFLAILLCGVLTGLGGMYLSMGYLTMFVRDMTAGRGFIALAACSMGQATPVGALLSSMIFAFFDGLSNILQVLKIPSEFIQMLPYLATIAGLTVYSIQKAAAAEKKMKNLKEAN